MAAARNLVYFAFRLVGITTEPLNLGFWYLIWRQIINVRTECSTKAPCHWFRCHLIQQILLIVHSLIKA